MPMPLCYCRRRALAWGSNPNVNISMNEPQLWLAAVAQPKSTEVPDYPHNYLAIPMFVPLAIH